MWLNERSIDRTTPDARTLPGFVNLLCEMSIDSNIIFDPNRNFGPSVRLRKEILRRRRSDRSPNNWGGILEILFPERFTLWRDVC
jgi:hypothetical protein